MFFWHCISWCLWERFVNLVVSDFKGVLSNRGIMSRFSWKKKIKATRGNYYWSHLCPPVSHALSVRAVPYQDHLCQETWHYISFLDWIASSPTDCFQCKMISGIRRHVLSCSALRCWLQKTWHRWWMSWHHSLRWKLLTQAQLCPFLLSQKDCLHYISTCFRDL